MTSFVGAIREGSPVHANAVDGIWSIALCEAAHKSIESGQPVSMKDFQP